MIQEKQYKILLVDDEEEVLNTSRFALRTAMIKDVMTCSDSTKVMELLEENNIDIMVMDIVMPHLSGKELLKQVREKHPEILVIMMTGLNDLDNVVECMRLGAIDYLDKPVGNLRLVTSIKRAIEFKEIQKENLNLRKTFLDTELRNPKLFDHIITQNGQMKKIFKYLEAISMSSRAVLITGETGTGKELIAESVHKLSGRKGEYVTINVAGLDDTLFSDALFGHKKGAFTGAGHNREGLLEKAQGGTLFLDEIGDLSMSSQVKLLRLLQEKEYYQLGDDIKKTTDARFVVATSQDIVEKVNEGTFRKDLYYRLHAHQVHIPPLRERKEDIELLAELFIKKASEEMGIKGLEIDPMVTQALLSYDFPGNIRELEAVLFNAVSQTINGMSIVEAIQNDVQGIELPKAVTSEATSPEVHVDVQHNILSCMEKIETIPTVDEMVDKLVEVALNKNNQNQTYAAKILGLSRQGLVNRMKKLRKQKEEAC